MTHTHQTCPTPTGGQDCNNGMLLDYCDFAACADASCSKVGHCECPCHNGRTCPCGHEWPATADDTPKDQT